MLTEIENNSGGVMSVPVSKDEYVTLRSKSDEGLEVEGLPPIKVKLTEAQAKFVEEHPALQNLIAQKLLKVA